MEKDEQNKETSKGKPMKILKRRNATFFGKEELVASQAKQKSSSQTVESDQQSFQAIASSASQKTNDKAQVSENSQIKLPSKENLQR